MGIISYGVHVPFYRLSRTVLDQVWGGSGGKGEKAVANADEDSLTMAVEAGMACLKGIDKASIEAIYFASTTPPFREKLSASLIAPALDLREDIVACDFTDSIRCGTIALRTALDIVKGGAMKRVLVIAADCRLPAPDSALEPFMGDGAVAFVIGNEDGIAEVEGSYSLTSEFVDIWRLEFDKYPRSWEDRFIREEGYFKLLPAAVSGLLSKLGVKADSITRAAYPALAPRDHASLAAEMHLNLQKQVQAPLLDKVGNTGSAFALTLLVAALEDSKLGDRILLANYGDGADAFMLRVTGAANSAMLKKQVSSKLMLDTYGKYIKFKDLMEFEHTPEMRPRSLVSQTWRDRKWIYRFHGHKCTKCGHVQFPMQRLCMYCGADEKLMNEVRLAENPSELVTYSLDQRAPVVNPPSVLAVVKIQGGGRFYGTLTDFNADELKVGMPMEFVFRRFHDALGFRNYFWRARPIRG